MTEYSTVRLPKQLMDQIDNFLEHQRLGYVSRAELVKDAVRSFLAKVNQTYPQPSGQSKTGEEEG